MKVREAIMNEIKEYIEDAKDGVNSEWDCSIRQKYVHPVFGLEKGNGDISRCAVGDCRICDLMTIVAMDEDMNDGIDDGEEEHIYKRRESDNWGIYNASVVCVESSLTFFKVGNIYDVIDGHIQNVLLWLPDEENAELKEAIKNAEFNSIDDINNILYFAKFLEIRNSEMIDDGWRK